jgi:bacterial/archaeal transporter family-2 protein
MLPLQAVINAKLAHFVGGPMWASAISAFVSMVVLSGVAGLIGAEGPRLAGLSSAPWWAWTGGLCGVVVLAATAAVTPRIGAASMTALVMAGQVLVAILFDRFGVFGLQVHEIGVCRLAAAVLLIAGAALMSIAN